MSRVTTQHQLYRRDVLQGIWSDERSWFGLISQKDQITLHEYYRPSEDLTPTELKAHWEQIRTEQPSMPNKAGKAIKRFKYAILLRHSGLPKRPIASLRPVIRPAPDLDVLTRALLEQARGEAA